MNTPNGNFIERIIPNLKNAIIKLTIAGKDSEMSLQDLSDNLPSNGGGGTNPTSSYVPFNNEGTFADSYIINDINNHVLKTNFEETDKGLYFDFNPYSNINLSSVNPINGSYQQFPNAISSFNNDFANLFLNHNFLSSDGLSSLKFGQLAQPAPEYEGGGSLQIVLDGGLWDPFPSTLYWNNEEGFSLNNYKQISLISISESSYARLDLSAYSSQLGFSNGTNNFALDFNVGSEIIATIHNGSNLGLNLNFPENIGGIGKGSSLPDNFLKGIWVKNLNGTNPNILIGDFDNDDPGNLTQLVVDDSSSTIMTRHQSEDAGINLDFNNKLYGFGQITAGNGTSLKIDDVNQKIILSPNLETASAGSGPAGKRLKISIGANSYLIDLLNP